MNLETVKGKQVIILRFLITDLRVSDCWNVGVVMSSAHMIRMCDIISCSNTDECFYLSDDCQMQKLSHGWLNEP